MVKSLIVTFDRNDKKLVATMTLKGCILETDNKGDAMIIYPSEIKLLAELVDVLKQRKNNISHENISD